MLAADIISEVLGAVIGASESDPKKAEGTKNMIKQLFLSGAKQEDMERALCRLKAVIEHYAKDIDAMKKPCTDCEKEKAKAVITTKSVFD